MKRMNGKLNLILSFGSLMVTVMLLIVAMFAWYANNDEAHANGIQGSTGIETNEFTLYYWNAKTSKWVESSSGIQIKDAWPDDVTYFKIVASGLEDNQQLSARFEGISTTLNTEIVTGGMKDTKYCVYYNGVSMYTSATTAINDSTAADAKTIYNLTSAEDDTYTVSLDDYKIENVYTLYTSPVIEDDAPTGKGTVKAASLTSTIFDVTATDETLTKYFALSFDSQGDADNYYQYQGIDIDSIVISL